MSELEDGNPKIVWWYRLRPTLSPQENLPQRVGIDEEGLAWAFYKEERQPECFSSLNVLRFAFNLREDDLVLEKR